MSADTLPAVTGALAQTANTRLTRAWNRVSPLIQAIPILTGGGQGGGKNVAWNVEFSGATAASFAEGSDIGGGEYSNDPVTLAKLDWGQYRSAFSLTNLEINAAAANIGNAAALEDMFAERLVGAITKIIAKVDQDCFSGTGTDGSGNPTIIGLDTALALTGSYAGLSKATYSEWAGNVRANSGVARALTLKGMAQLEQDIFTASSLDPNFMLTTAASHTAYEQLFEPTRRTVDNGGAPIQAYNGGAPRLNWRGNPVGRDRFATAGKLYMLNLDEIEMRVLPWANVPDGVSVRQLMGMSQTGDRSGPVALPIHVYPIARTGSAVKFCAEIYLQLKVTRTNAHGIFADIDET